MTNQEIINNTKSLLLRANIILDLLGNVGPNILGDIQEGLAELSELEVRLQAEELGLPVHELKEAQSL